MSKHLSENKKKKSGRPQTKRNRLLETLRLYPDFGADSDWYPAGWRIPVFLLAGMLILLISLFLREGSVLRLAFQAASLILVGFHCVVNLVQNIRVGRFCCEALPVVVACLAGFAAGMVLPSVLVMLFYQAVKLVEITAVRRQQEGGQAILSILPQTASLLEENEFGKSVRTIKPVHIKEGDLLTVQPGEIIPIDGVVEEGLSTVDLSPLTRSKKLVAVNIGHAVYGGCRNLSEPLTVRASCDFGASTAPRVYSSFTATIRKESEDERLTVRVSNIAYLVLFVAALLFGVIVPLFTHGWNIGVRRAMVFLLAACPFAIKGALSLAVFSGVSEIFANGIIIREIRMLFSLAKLETFICNKTCTVTESAYTVREICPSGVSEEALLSVLVKAESGSEHPIAKALRSYAGVSEHFAVRNIIREEIPCKGISARIGKNDVLAGNATLLFENGVNCSVPEGQGIAIHAAVNGKYCGYILLENPVREGNYDAIEQLRASGVKNFALLSGDLRSVVRPIASALNFNVVKAELDREGKTAAAAYLNGNRTQGRTLAYAGDGSNELASVPKGGLSVSTSALGNEEAAKADVVILGEGFMRFPAAVRAGRASSRLSFLSVTVHFALRLLMILLALAGVCSPIAAAALFAASSILSYLFASFFFNRI